MGVLSKFNTWLLLFLFIFPVLRVIRKSSKLSIEKAKKEEKIMSRENFVILNMGARLLSNKFNIQ